MKYFDCLVIGSGPSSEPVVANLKFSKLKTCIIDGGNLFQNKKRHKSIKKINYINNLSPKQILQDYKFIKDRNSKLINKKLKIECNGFNYVFNINSGGLSPVWGGGAFEWPNKEIERTTSIEINDIRKSYKKIRERLNIKKRDSFSSLSQVSKSLLNKNKKNKIKFFPTEYFLSNSYKDKNNKEQFGQHLIWNSAINIAKYISESSNIFYKENTIVLSIKYLNNFWELECFNSNKKKSFKIKTKAIISCAGTINTTSLIFSALNKNNIELNLLHNNIFIYPLLNFSINGILNKENIELPELSWLGKILSNTRNIIISGYFINSLLIIKKINSLPIIKKFNFIKNFIKFLFSKIFFITVFTDQNLSNIKLILNKEFKNAGLITMKISNNSSRNILKKESKIIEKFFKKNLPKSLNLFSLLRQFTAIGGDVHYAGTIPDLIGGKSEINTNSIGEISEKPNIFICDPSRLAYLSTLPHTFTIMAINEASMPKIIAKIKSIKI